MYKLSHIINPVFVNRNSDLIHIYRNEEDAVSSLYFTAKKYPETWAGNWSVKKCVDKWLSSIKTSKHHLEKQKKQSLLYQFCIFNQLIIRSHRKNM